MRNFGRAFLPVVAHAGGVKTAPQVATVPGLIAQEPESALRCQRVLVLTDFSALSRPAVTAAAALAGRWPDVSVCLAHVVPPAVEGKGAEPAERATQARKQLAALTPLFACDDVDVETRILSGPPGHAICEISASGEFDLIILSSHGATGMAKMVLGGTAECVVWEAKTPVLVIKPRVTPAGALVPIDLHLHRILVGIDRRAGAQLAFEAAVEIAGRCRASLILVQALPPHPAPAAPSKADIAAATARLQQLRSRHLPEAAAWEIRVTIGGPAQVLVDAAKASRSDLIVLGPHEHTRWGHGFAGSTAEQVLTLAPCAVLALK